MVDLNENPTSWLLGRLVDEGEVLPPREPTRVPRGITRRATPRDMPARHPAPAARFSDNRGPQGSHNPALSASGQGMTQGGGTPMTSTTSEIPPAQPLKNTPEERVQWLKRNALDKALKEVLNKYPDQELHYTQWTALLLRDGIQTTEKSVNAGLARLERDGCWGVQRPRSGAYAWYPDRMDADSLFQNPTEARRERRLQFLPPPPHGSYPAQAAPQGVPQAVSVLPVAPVAAVPPAGSTAPQNGYDSRSRFRYVGPSPSDGAVVIQDPDGQLLKAWPM